MVVLKIKATDGQFFRFRTAECTMDEVVQQLASVGTSRNATVVLPDGSRRTLSQDALRAAVRAAADAAGDDELDAAGAEQVVRLEVVEEEDEALLSPLASGSPIASEYTESMELGPAASTASTEPAFVHPMSADGDSPHELPRPSAPVLIQEAHHPVHAQWVQQNTEPLPVYAQVAEGFYPQQQAFHEHVSQHQQAFLQHVYHHQQAVQEHMAQQRHAIHQHQQAIREHVRQQREAVREQALRQREAIREHARQQQCAFQQHMQQHVAGLQPFLQNLPQQLHQVHQDVQNHVQAHLHNMFGSNAQGPHLPWAFATCTRAHFCFALS